MGILVETFQATIAIDTAVSGVVNLLGKQLCGIEMPAVWDAADITFQASIDGGATWKNLYGADGNPLKLTTPAAGRLIKLSTDDLIPWTLLKLQSGVPGGTVNQTAERVLTLVAMKLFPVR